MNPTPQAGDLSDYAGAYGEQQVSVVGDKLHVVRGRRPPVVLSALGPDLFTVIGDPTRRVQFTRDGSGRVTTMDSVSIGGPGPRARRTD